MRITEHGLTRFRWFIVTLLFFATTINYIDRQILALLKPILDQELGWTNEEFGWVNSAFFGVYAVSLDHYDSMANVNNFSLQGLSSFD